MKGARGGQTKQESEDIVMMNYEVWALGYDNDGDRTDAEILLQSFKTPLAAVLYAREVTWEKVSQIDKDKVFDGINNISIEVETVVSDEDGESNIDTIFSKALENLVEECC